jgi:ribosomal protein S18 acetylase RimI-like enzyme
MIRSRNFAGATDLDRMATLVLDAHAALGPRFECAVGDVYWRMYRATTVRPHDNIRLWEQGTGGALIGFAWFIPNGDLDLVVFPRAWCDAIVPEMLAWGAERAGAGGAARERDGRLVAWALASNLELTRALLRCGFGHNDEAYVHMWRSLDSELPRPVLPDGFSLRASAGPEEAAARAALHRAAFPHSHISAAGYAELMASRPYRPHLDVVVTARGGDLAAMALAWLDSRNRTGEFEPTGTHPANRRKGLARAAIAEALRRLRECGARQAIVYAAARDPGSVDLYRGLGFAILDTNRGSVRV